MRIFIAHKYEEGKPSEAVSLVKQTVKECGHIPYAFTDEGYIPDPRAMMEKAFARLDESDLLIVEASRISMGSGVEAGYFKSKGRPIVVLYESGTLPSRTLSGIATSVIEYGSGADLRSKLAKALPR